MNNCYDIMWSIYLTGNNPSKVKRKQIPEIEKRLDPIPEKWVIMMEPYNPDVVKIVGNINLSGLTKPEIALWMLKNCTRLAASTWQFSGLSSIYDDKMDLYLMASAQPEMSFPAIHSVVMELEKPRSVPSPQD